MNTGGVIFIPPFLIAEDNFDSISFLVKLIFVDDMVDNEKPNKYSHSPTNNNLGFNI